MSIETIKSLVSARYSLIYIESMEERRVIEQLQETPWKVLCWSVTRGLYSVKYSGNYTIVKDIRDPLKMIEHIMNAPSGGSIYVLVGFEPYLKDGFIVRKLKDAVQYLRTSSLDSILIIGAGGSLPAELEPECVTVQWPLPDFEEFELLVESVAMDERFCKDNDMPDKKRIGEIARNMLGMKKLDAENALAMSLVEKKAIDMKYILDQKERIIRKSGFLECINNTKGMNEIGGMSNLKKWIQCRAGFVANDISKENRYNLPPPRGVLLVGVQGCGKSLFAQGLSAYLKLPLIKFDVGRIFSSTVGSSERNMREAIKVAESVAPAILLVDEIEKSLSGIHSSSHSDGGTTARVVATFLTWLQDRTKNLFIVATANSIEQIPPELIRKGRLDEIFFVDLPSVKERKQILEIHFRAHNVDPEAYNLFLLSEKTEGYTGAEIEQIVISTLYESIYLKKAPTQAAFMNMIEQVIPMSKTMGDYVAALRKWAYSRARAAGDNSGQNAQYDNITSIVSRN